MPSRRNALKVPAPPSPRPSRDARSSSAAVPPAPDVGTASRPTQGRAPRAVPTAARSGSPVSGGSTSTRPGAASSDHRASSSRQLGLPPRPGLARRPPRPTRRTQSWRRARPPARRVRDGRMGGRGTGPIEPLRGRRPRGTRRQAQRGPPSRAAGRPPVRGGLPAMGAATGGRQSQSHPSRTTAAPVASRTRTNRAQARAAQQQPRDGDDQRPGHHDEQQHRRQGRTPDDVGGRFRRPPGVRAETSTAWAASHTSSTPTRPRQSRRAAASAGRRRSSARARGSAATIPAPSAAAAHAGLPTPARPSQPAEARAGRQPSPRSSSGATTQGRVAAASPSVGERTSVGTRNGPSTKTTAPTHGAHDSAPSAVRRAASEAAGQSDRTDDGEHQDQHPPAHLDGVRRETGLGAEPDDERRTAAP